MVLAAGKGTRLLPLTGEMPKPMAPVVGKPIMQHIFELLARYGVEEAHVNVYYLAEAILGCYGEKTQVDGMSVNISREERLMGTAGGVKRLADRFDETFIVIMGDALTDVNLREVVAFHKERGALATLALMPVSDTSRYGVVELDGEGGHPGLPGETPSHRGHKHPRQHRHLRSGARGVRLYPRGHLLRLRERSLPPSARGRGEVRRV
jgi:mannose-1-phosphate guanylyltransferase